MMEQPRKTYDTYIRLALISNMQRGAALFAAWLTLFTQRIAKVAPGRVSYRLKRHGFR